MINRIILVNILFLYNQKTLDPWRIWLNLCVLPENTWSMTDMVEFVCITRKHLIHDGHGWICVYYQKTLDPWRIWLNLCVLPENTWSMTDMVEFVCITRKHRPWSMTDMVEFVCITRKHRSWSMTDMVEFVCINCQNACMINVFCVLGVLILLLF